MLGWKINSVFWTRSFEKKKNNGADPVAQEGKKNEDGFSLWPHMF